MTLKDDNIISRLRSKIKPENRLFIKKNLEIVRQVNVLLDQKGWNRRDFAGMLQKEPSEVSKWLSGTQNLTLQSIAKMEAVLGEDIITTPLVACEKYKQIKYIVFNVTARENNLSNPPDISYPETLESNNNQTTSIIAA